MPHAVFHVITRGRNIGSYLIASCISYGWACGQMNEFAIEDNTRRDEKNKWEYNAKEKMWTIGYCEILFIRNIEQ
jgi:hypothetical protein